MSKSERLFKAEIFVKEFSFLTKYISMREIDRMKIQKVGLSFYEQILDWITSGDESKIYENLNLLDENGDLIAMVGRYLEGDSRLPKKWYNPITWFDGDPLGESVSDTLSRIGDRGEKIHYALSVWGYRIILYKVPKGFNLVSWREELIKKSQEEIKNEIRRIDE